MITGKVDLEYVRRLARTLFVQITFVVFVDCMVCIVKQMGLYTHDVPDLYISRLGGPIE